MRLARLKTKNSDPLYLNVLKITSVYKNNLKKTVIVYKHDSLTITMPIDEVVQEINNALKNTAEDLQELVFALEQLLRK